MNWIVTVQTEQSQIIEVSVQGYIQIRDAERAALSQTGASKVLYAIPDYSSDSSGTNSSQSSSYVSYDNDMDLVEGLLMMGAGVLILLGIASVELAMLGAVLLTSAFIHYLIRKIREHLS